MITESILILNSIIPLEIKVFILFIFIYVIHQKIKKFFDL